MKDFSDYKSVIVNVDFQNKDNAHAIVESSSKNVKIVDGALCSLGQLVTHNLRVLGTNSAFECDACTMIATTSGNFIVINGRGTFFSDFIFTKPTYLYCAEQKTMLVSEKGVGTVGYTDTMTKYSDRGFVSMAYCNERAVGVEGNVLYFTARDDVTKWNGELALPCRVAAVVSYGNDLLAVGDEIFKIELSDDAANSKVTSLCSGVGKVYPKTVVAFGKKVTFLTDSGLYVFANGKTTRICKDIPFAAENSEAVAIRKDGYWLVFDNAAGERLLLGLGNDGSEFMFVVNATALTCIENEIVMVVDGVLKKISESSPISCAELSWISKSYDFGNRFVRKHFRKLTVVAEGEFDVHLVTERERRIYHFTDGSHKIRLNGYFAQVSLEVHATSKIRVEKLALEAQSFGGEATHGYNK